MKLVIKEYSTIYIISWWPYIWPCSHRISVFTGRWDRPQLQKQLAEKIRNFFSFKLFNKITLSCHVMKTSPPMTYWSMNGHTQGIFFYESSFYINILFWYDNSMLDFLLLFFFPLNIGVRVDFYETSQHTSYNNIYSGFQRNLSFYTDTFVSPELRLWKYEQ